MDDWYKVTKQKLSDHGGKELWKHYPSVEELMRAMYPDFPWKSEHFASAKSQWRNLDFRNQFFQTLSQKLSIKEVGFFCNALRC